MTMLYLFTILSKKTSLRKNFLSLIDSELYLLYKRFREVNFITPVILNAREY